MPGDLGEWSTAQTAEGQMLTDYQAAINDLNTQQDQLGIDAQRQALAATATQAMTSIWADYQEALKEKNSALAANCLSAWLSVMNDQDNLQTQLASQIHQNANNYANANVPGGANAIPGLGYTSTPSGTASANPAYAGLGAGGPGGGPGGNAYNPNGTSLTSATSPNSTGTSNSAYGGLGGLTDSLLPLMLMSSILPMSMMGMGGRNGLGDPAANQPTLASDTKSSGDGSDSGGTNAAGAGYEGGGVSQMQPVSDSDSQSSSTQQPSSIKSAGNSTPDGSNNDVKLPDGTTTRAPNAQAASAVRAALNGATPADAYQQAGVALPPPGTPVVDPQSPNGLLPGDVGVWKDHHLIALGDGKVLVDGQVQSVSSIQSSPDFLGWMRPTQQSSSQTTTYISTDVSPTTPTPTEVSSPAATTGASPLPVPAAGAPAPPAMGASAPS